ncbi:MAG: hypothetical protein LUD00_12420 [Prevotellaceae bacterium]|nr:hypothetical protein [Prevotellaceae bacterium]
MEKEPIYNELDIRNALKRKYARKAEFPKDFGEKVMKRMEAERKAVLCRRIVRIGMSSAAAFFVVLCWICVSKKEQSEKPQPIVARQVSEEHQEPCVKQDTAAIAVAAVVSKEGARKENRKKKNTGRSAESLSPTHIAERKDEKEQEPVHVQEVRDMNMEEVIAARFELAMTVNQELREELQLNY